MFQGFVLIGLQSWMCNSELDWALAHSSKMNKENGALAKKL